MKKSLIYIIAGIVFVVTMLAMFLKPKRRISKTSKSMARRKKPRKPKAPKSKTIKSLTAYKTRLMDWKKKVKAWEDEPKKVAKLKADIQKIK
jgi:hypothetical protein